MKRCEEKTHGLVQSSPKVRRPAPPPLREQIAFSATARRLQRDPLGCLQDFVTEVGPRSKISVLRPYVGLSLRKPRTLPTHPAGQLQEFHEDAQPRLSVAATTDWKGSS